MITREKINEILGISESYQMPDALMAKLLNREECIKMFDEILKYCNDMTVDWFTDYFQTEHGDRGALKQDFTPLCLTNLISRLQSNSNNVFDICAGTGGLTISAWARNKSTDFYCEEISTRTIPVLLLNLAIRNINAIVRNGNSLAGDITVIYKLVQSEKYSDITVLSSYEQKKVNTVISNPPYSLKWDDVDKFKNDSRFIYGLPPKSKADYAFIQHGISQLCEGGEAFYIIPGGVLYRGQKEGEIRKKLIQDNALDTVIGLPDNLFLNTCIAVCVMVFKKSRKCKDVLFIDATKEYVKQGKQNVMQDEHISKIVNAYKKREELDKFSHIASIEEIEDNDFNLNIPRYVDTFEPQPVPDLYETIKELHELDKEVHSQEMLLLSLMKELVGNSVESEKEHQRAIREYEEYVKEKYSHSCVQEGLF